MIQRIWHQVSPARLLVLCLVEAVLLALVLATTSVAAHALRFCREDRIAIVFAASKKSLMNGLPIAAVLSVSAPHRPALMLFHQMQLMVCAAIAHRWSRWHEAAVSTAT